MDKKSWLIPALKIYKFTITEYFDILNYEKILMLFI